MNIEIKDEDIMELVPLHVRKINENYMVIKKEDMTSLITQKPGITVIKMIEKKKTLSEIKETIALEYEIEKSTVNITPIIQTLILNNFVSRIGNRILFKEKSKLIVQVNYFISTILLASIFELLLNSIKIPLFYDLLKKLFYQQIHVEKSILKTAEASLQRTNATGKKFLTEYENLQKKIIFDKTLFFKLNYNSLDYWLNKYFVIENKDYFKQVLGKKVIYCSYHTCGFELLPFILAGHGLELLAPVAYKDDFFMKLIDRNEEIKKYLNYTVPKLLSRSEKDGIILYKALKNDKNILLFCDTHILLSDDFIDVFFLGTIIKVNRGAALLHKRTKAPIVPVLTYHNGMRCFVKFFPMINYEEAQTEKDVTQQLFDVLQSHLEKYPHHWAKWHDLEEMIVEKY